jgi:hypothetical protein
MIQHVYVNENLWGNLERIGLLQHLFMRNSMFFIVEVRVHTVRAEIDQIKSNQITLNHRVSSVFFQRLVLA